MTAVTRLRMTADEFIPWAMTQPRRYELVAGEVVPMSPERVGLTRTKYLVWLAFREAVQAADRQCEVLGDGPSVRIDDRTVYEPDALLRTGAPTSEDSSR